MAQQTQGAQSTHSDVATIQEDVDKMMNKMDKYVINEAFGIGDIYHWIWRIELELGDILIRVTGC